MSKVRQTVKFAGKTDHYVIDLSYLKLLSFCKIKFHRSVEFNFASEEWAKNQKILKKVVDRI